MPTPEQVRGDKEQDGDAGINASTRNNESPSRCSEDDNSGMTKDDAKARFLWKALVVANAWCEFLCI